MTNEELICTGCGKHPDQLEEYIDAAAAEPEFYTDAADYVTQEEGTLDPSNGHFLCTDCYIAAGMPSHPRGWTAP